MKRTSKIALTILLTSILALGTGGCDDDDDVTGTNLPPIANAGADATFTDLDGNGAQQVTLDGTESEDPDGSIQVYRWLDELGAVVAGGPTATPTLDVGVHVITLEVVDDQGASDTDEVTITVEEPNAAPVADAGPNQTVVDDDGDGTELVTLDGRASSDPNGVITTWVWTEAGTSIAAGQMPEVTLPVGVHEIMLTVTDDDLETDSDVVLVTVEPQPL